MRVIRIIVDGREYVLPAEHDIAVIMDRITERLRDGGGFVELMSTPERTLNVLVSPGMSLSIEVLPTAQVVSGADQDVQPVDQSWFDPFDLS